MSPNIDLWYKKYWDQFSPIFYTSDRRYRKPASPNEVAASLIPIIKKSADWACVEALAKYVAHTAHISPKDIEYLSQALSYIQTQTDIPVLTISKPKRWEGSTKTSYSAALSACLSEAIDDGLEDTYADDEDGEGQGDLRIEPDNIRLTTAILSASTIKYGLQSTEKGVAAVRLALQDELANEVFAVVACLHLAVCGDRMYAFLEETLPEGGINLALKKMRVREVMKVSRTQNLLERTISIVEGKFSRMIMLSEQEAWEILFS